jgi:hypothetical protein
VTFGPFQLLVRYSIDPDLEDVAISIITFGYGRQARLTVFGSPAGTPTAKIGFQTRT